MDQATKNELFNLLMDNCFSSASKPMFITKCYPCEVNNHEDCRGPSCYCEHSFHDVEED